MDITATQLKTSKRRLVVRDSVAFVVLVAVTGVLFAITLFLFRSFSAHRAAIATQSATDGRLALSQGHPREAIADLRTALSYAPNDRNYALLLAQALAEDGHLEEAISYFLNLWESQPGDGFINLQLARLERQRNESQTAINYYHSSIYGSWPGDGVTRRRDVRLELANYLIDQKQFALAQTELLIASSNAPAIPGFALALGDTLLRAEDQADALKQYKKAIAENPHDALAYEKAGHLAYNMGDYAEARDFLQKAPPESGGTLSSQPGIDDAALLRNAERLLVLQPELATTRPERALRILDIRAIAKKRFDACFKQVPQPNLSLETLATRWNTLAGTASRAALLRDDTTADSARSLVADTEIVTAQLCGAPEGDNALLLLLAQRNRTSK